MKTMTMQQVDKALGNAQFNKMTIEVDLQRHGWSKSNGIPLWAMACLGGAVTLTRAYDEYGDGETVHQVGKVGKLDGIQSKNPGAPVALVEFAGGDLVPIPFDHLEQA